MFIQVSKIFKRLGSKFKFTYTTGREKTVLWFYDQVSRKPTCAATMISLIRDHTSQETNIICADQTV